MAGLSASGGAAASSLRNLAGSDTRSLRTDSDGGGESMERSLALLTAQYEKNNRSSVNSQVGVSDFL